MTKEQRKQQLRRKFEGTFIAMFSIVVGVTVVNVNNVSKNTTKVFSETTTQEAAEQLPGILVEENTALKLGMFEVEVEDDKEITKAKTTTEIKKKTKKAKKKKHKKSSKKSKKVAASNAEESTTVEQEAVVESTWEGETLNRTNGTVQGPSGKETYYNLEMSGVVRLMKAKGFDYEYWVREDGVKMYGDYIMCAANLNIRPKGTIVETSLGTGMVCDTGSFASSNAYQLDIAVSW